MQKSIDTLMQYLQKNNNIATDTYTKSKSPLSITDEGYAVVKKFGIDKMIERNWDKTTQYINDNLKSNNLYDIQQFLIESVTVFMEKFSELPLLGLINLLLQNTNL
ncbi:hypothetical protein EZS27_044075 [termite gut metagenome]|uniref:Uncharacterized protein n=1 Tax=termite gut metagenome TaxID=433724 RepID=A0A5J4P597_9ZZZZ